MPASPESAPALPAPPPPRLGRYRWVICSLLFFATTVNYADRQVIGLLAPMLSAKFHWTELDYGHIVMAFQIAYAIGMVVMGRVIDVLGTRLGYALAVIVWSLASMSHAFARTVFGFAAARFALGLGESGNFPAAIKTVAEWFPKKERALATGIFNAGSNVGAILAPVAVPFIVLHLGWQSAFFFTGALDLIWLCFWLKYYRRPQEHPKLTAPELAYIQSDPVEPMVKIPWRRLIPHRQTLAFALGKFLTDPVWWFYLYWIPKFLSSRFELSLTGLALPLIIIYVAADAGSVGGGWISSALIKRGWSVNAGRKTAMLICALCVVPIILASEARNSWEAVALLSLATAAHQGWSANIFTTVSDMFPRRAVASVVGIGGMAGAIGGALIADFAGYILQTTHSYLLLFVIAGSAYLVALLVFHLLVPTLEPAKLEET